MQSLKTLSLVLDASQVSLIENPNFDFTITWGKDDHPLKLFPAMKVSQVYDSAASK